MHGELLLRPGQTLARTQVHELDISTQSKSIRLIARHGMADATQTRETVHKTETTIGADM